MKLVYHPNKILRSKCRAVKTVTEGRRKKIEKMKELMRSNDGIGLAAPQVGWNARVFVMNVSEDRDPAHDLVFVNPFVMAVGGDLYEMEEGCLSLPGVVGIVSRRQKVKVYAWDINGQAFMAEDHGLGGRCMLHEIDHLDGILILDRASEFKKGVSSV